MLEKNKDGIEAFDNFIDEINEAISNLNATMQKYKALQVEAIESSKLDEDSFEYYIGCESEINRAASMIMALQTARNLARNWQDSLY